MTVNVRFKSNANVGRDASGRVTQELPHGVAMCCECRGQGVLWGRACSGYSICPSCDGVGLDGLEHGPTHAQPGSNMKVALLALRYRDGWVDDASHGHSLFHPGDFRVNVPFPVHAFDEPDEPADEPEGDDDFCDDDF